jgi:hypothetical protein
MSTNTTKPMEHGAQVEGCGGIDMREAVTDLQLTLPPRTAAAGQLSPSTAQEATELQNLIRDGKLTQAGWCVVKEVDRDPFMG